MVVLACNSAQGACMAVLSIYLSIYLSICATKFLGEASAETAAAEGWMAPIVVIGGLALCLSVGWLLRWETERSERSRSLNKAVGQDGCLSAAAG